MDHDLPRTPSISVQWNRIFAACGNRAQPRPGASWRVALGAPVMSTLAPVVILEATDPAGRGAVFTGPFGFADSNKDRRAVTSTPVLKQDHKK